MKKIIAMFMLIMLVCCGCGKKAEEVTTTTDLDNIMKRDVLLVGVKTDTYPFGYYDQKGSFSGYDAALARIIARGLLGSDKKVKFIYVFEHHHHAKRAHKGKNKQTIARIEPRKKARFARYKHAKKPTHAPKK